MGFNKFIQAASVCFTVAGLYSCGGGNNASHINVAPIARAMTVGVTEGEAIEVQLLAYDDDDDDLTYIIVTPPLNGAMAIDGDRVTYTPAADFSGTDSFNFKVNDGVSDSDIAEVTLNVEAINDTPVAVALSANTYKNTAVEVTLKATDIDSTVLEYLIVALPSHGTLGALVGDKVTYMPAANYSGPDQFSYVVNDGIASSAPVYVSITTQVAPVATLTGKLNDTGITYCATYNNNAPCPVDDYPDQDAEYGRDFTNNDDSDGKAGFSYTKLDFEGNELPVDASIWSCVRDNVTGLIWEVKQNRSDWEIVEGMGTYGIVDYKGLHDSNDRFSWFSTDTTNDGGWSGFDGVRGDSCYGYEAGAPSTYCNTEAFASRVNSEGLCGASDWRLPKREELRSILSYGPPGWWPNFPKPTLDLEYFAGTGMFGSRFWSSTPYANDNVYAWTISFGINHKDGVLDKSFKSSVRLVRGGRL